MKKHLVYLGYMNPIGLIKKIQQLIPLDAELEADTAFGNVRIKRENPQSRFDTYRLRRVADDAITDWEITFFLSKEECEEAKDVVIEIVTTAMADLILCGLQMGRPNIKKESRQGLKTILAEAINNGCMVSPYERAAFFANRRVFLGNTPISRKLSIEEGMFDLLVRAFQKDARGGCITPSVMSTKAYELKGFVNCEANRLALWFAYCLVIRLADNEKDEKWPAALKALTKKSNNISDDLFWLNMASIIR